MLSRKYFELKPEYTLSDFRAYFNLGRKAVLGMLKRQNIPLHFASNRYFIYLNDLKAYAPDFYESCLIASQEQRLLDLS